MKRLSSWNCYKYLSQVSEDPTASFQCVLCRRPSIEVYSLMAPKACQKKTHTPFPQHSSAACGLQYLKVLSIRIASLTFCSSSQAFTNTGNQSRWRRHWRPTPVLLPGKSHGRSLVGCSPWGCTVGHDWSDLTAAVAATSLGKKRTISLALPSPVGLTFCWTTFTLTRQGAGD